MFQRAGAGIWKATLGVPLLDRTHLARSPSLPLGFFAPTWWPDVSERRPEAPLSALGLCASPALRCQSDRAIEEKAAC